MEFSNIVLLLYILKTICFVSSSAYIQTPDYIHPCDNPTPSCLKRSIQQALAGFTRGTPELGIQPLDPLVLERVELTLPGGINITFMDGVTEGFKKCTVNSAKFLKDNLEFSIRCNLVIRGKYKSSGRLLLFPIDGEGDSIIKCKNLDITVSIKLGTVRQQDSNVYFQVKSYKSTHKYNGQVIYYMTNLIKNNPEISKSILQFMNANWKMIAEEFGDPIVEFGLNLVMSNIQKLFSEVPLRNLFRTPIL